MKKIKVIIILAFFTTCAWAQSVDDDVAIIQSLWGKEKRAIVTDYMKLSPTNEAGFWKVYDAYEAERKANGANRINLINEYIKNYGTLTDQKATELVNKWIQINIGDEKLLQKTFKNMSGVVSAVKAAQFIQLEKYLSQSIQTSLQENIPFIGELETEMNRK